MEYQNRLLASLLPEVLAQIAPHLKTVDLVHGEVLFHAGDAIERVYFVHSGAVSLVVELSEGQMIESAMVGRDSIVGALAALDGRIALSKGIVQMEGKASVLDVETLRRVARTNESFLTTLIRHEQAIFAQAQQSAACNATHTVEERLARWLLRTRDLSGSDVLPLTQEFLAEMLGVRRTSVSIVAHTLQKAGLISYSRGNIRVTNLQGLQDTSCECYESVRTHYTRLLGNQAAAE